MIIYGDPSFEQSLGSLIRGLEERIEAARVWSPGGALDGWRSILIAAGQVEQGVEDSEEADEVLRERVRALVDEAAKALCAKWLNSPDVGEASRSALARMATALRECDHASDVAVRVKVPEGFAFYSLFPEQFCAAAQAWAQGRDRSQPVVVVGIRSIGTSLSAVVRSTLERAGWNVRRLTVRPRGHPFERTLTFGTDDLRGASNLLVVDEGPGASGSSMAAVARAAVAAGVPAERVFFLPGHGGESGPHASAEVRQWWARVTRFMTPLDELRWGGRTLKEELAERTRGLLGPAAVVERVEDLSAGLWRDVIECDRSNLPPAFPLFERTKYRCVLRDGRSVLWKFAGLCDTHEGGVAAAALRVMSSRSAEGWAEAPLGAALGFVASSWVNGRTLVPQDAEPAVVAHVGRYIRSAAAAPLGEEERAAAFERLRDLLYWNTRESLGEVAADASRRHADTVEHWVRNSVEASYGDGRVGPWEWVREPSGRIRKVDCAGHSFDHTAIGRQPLLWDVAGALVEWNLRNGAEPLLRAAAVEGTPPAVLAFYRRAYAAFRVGMCAMCGIDSSAYLEHLRAGPE